MHQRYGSTVRIAPNELSFAETGCWKDIYSNRGTQPAFPRSNVWNGPALGAPPMFVDVIDDKEHARMKRKIEPGFTVSAVRSQESIVQGRKRRDGLVDIVQWLTFATIDIITDLAFGEPFDLIRKGELNDWVGITFGSARHRAVERTLRLYPWVTRLLQKLVPKSVTLQMGWLWSVVQEKVGRRLANTKPSVVISWSCGRGSGKGEEGLSRGEVHANSFLMAIAGSETVATTLSGTLNRLVKNPHQLTVLTKDMREKCRTDGDLTFAALQELDYLNAVINEGFRTCSAVPSGLPRITPPTGGSVCGHNLPGNIFVRVHETSLWFSPNHFFAPKSFRPERWMPESTDNPVSPYYNDDLKAVQAFSIGPRSCIGKNFAMAELRLVLAKLVWNFDIQEADTEAGRLVWEDQREFLLVEKKPFKIKLVLRES